MRIAAGVLLIIASIFSACGGIAYGFGGGLMAAAGSAGSEINKELAKDVAAENDPEAKAGLEAAQKLADSGKSSGSMIMIFGIFLLVLFGLQIAGGVCLFTQKAANFVLIIGALGILSEPIGIYIKYSIVKATEGIANMAAAAGGAPVQEVGIMDAIGIGNLFGLVAGVLAIVASRSIGKHAMA